VYSGVVICGFEQLNEIQKRFDFKSTKQNNIDSIVPATCFLPAFATPRRFVSPYGFEQLNEIKVQQNNIDSTCNVQEVEQ
jgi:hypothetical protein